jgi:predicted PurR-regulated permease PerM
MWKDTPFYVKSAIGMVLITLLIYGAIMARQFLIPFTIAVFFTFLLLPLSHALESARIPRALAIILSLVVAAAVFGGLIYFLVMQVENFADEWPELKEELNHKWVTIQQFINQEFSITRRQQSLWINQKMQETIHDGDVYALGIFSATGTFFAGLLVIPIYVFFLSYYREKFKAFIRLLSKDYDPEKVLEIIRQISTVSQKYMKGLLMDVFILSVLNSTGFLILGLRHAILFGVLASILNIIPYIGVLIGSILPVLMALLTEQSISVAVGVAFVAWFVQLLDNNFITPYVVGSSVSINPLAAFLALIISALIWGVPRHGSLHSADGND